MPSLKLQPLSQCKSVVEIFNKSRYSQSNADQGGYIVEQQGIRCWNSTSELTQSLPPLHKTFGYTIAAFHLYELVYCKEYILLLKSNGTIEILDDKLKLVDQLVTSTPQCSSKRTVFLFDSNNLRLYINLEETSIDCIPLMNKNSTLSFVKDKNNSYQGHHIFLFSSTIVDADFCSHFNEYTGEEFDTITVLLCDKFNEFVYSRTIYLVNPRNTRIHRKWSLLLANINTTMKSYEFKNEFSNVKSIPNMGFFIFTSRGVTFLTLPNGPQNFIENNLINNVYFNENMFCDVDSSNDYCKIKVELIYRDNLILFNILTVRNQLIKLRMKKIREAEDKYIVYWSRPIHGITKIIDNKISNNDMINKTTHSFLLEAGEINFALLNDQDIVFVRNRNYDTIEFNQNAHLFPKKFNSVLPHYIDCNINGKAEISSFDILKLRFNSNFELKEVGKYSVDDKKHFVDYVDVVKIRNEDSEKYCMISDKGIITWSDNAYEFEIPEFSSSNRYCLDSLSLKDGKNITLITSNVLIIILKDFTRVEREISLQNESLVIGSILSLEINNQLHIWLADLYGNIIIFDCYTNKISDKFKLHYKGLKFSDIPGPNGTFLIYDHESLIVVKFDDRSLKYKFLPFYEIPFSIDRIFIANERDALRFISKENIEYSVKVHMDWYNSNPIIYRAGIPKGPQIIKFIQLSPTSKYLICIGYENGNENGDNEGKSKVSCLYLFDLHDGKIVDRVNLSFDYPQNIITDIIAVPYGGSNIHKNFAEQLILNQCFLISLNYEMAENDESNNLLLFMLDDDIGKIIFEKGIDTRSSITCLKNYEQNYFMIAGDFLQMYQINYSVKWNSFVINLVSNEMELNGMIKNMISFNGMAKYDDSNEDSHTLLLLDLYKGVKEIKLYSRMKRQRTNLEQNDNKFEFRSILSSQENELLNDVSQMGIITHMEFYIIDKDSLWYIFAYQGDKVRLYYYSDGEYLREDIQLPNQIINVRSTDSCDENENRTSRGVYTCIFNCEDDVMHDLFVITTTNNGSYIVSTMDKGKKFSKENMIRLSTQRKYINTGDADTDLENESDDDDDDNDDEGDEDEIIVYDINILQ